ncbi:RHS repeat-associated core domain-containing protein [Streptomyces lacrimifluminis]|nr:RHS repeat-associated core domain-containing protein [Streptomyces lacrimifluminis]
MIMRRFIASGTAVTLVVGLVAGIQSPAGADESWPPIKPDRAHLVDTAKVPVKAPPPDKVAEAVAKWKPAASWPAAWKAEVTPPAAATQFGARRVRAKALPVWVGAASGSVLLGGAGKSATPPTVQVEMIDHPSAKRRSVDGLMLKLSRTDGKTEPGKVSLTVDYSSFRHAYGGDWAARLRLVEVPNNGSAGKVLTTTNDVEAGTATADVTVARAGSTFALTAAPNGETGDYKATSLSPSGSWAVSTQSGDFTYSYPLKVPAAPGGLEPDLSLSYSSGSVDGQTAATNNQASAMGLGWDMWPGSIERSYMGCADDITDPLKKTGDLCWETDNASLSLDGRSSRLVYAGGNRWRPEKDDGSRIERLTGVDNGDKGGSEGVGEHWKLTTTDGTQYFFGQTKTSAWAVPVFGNEDGEPCKQATFDASWCDQAYRWNLDKVIDTHGNTITYSYTPETNNYGRNLSGAKTTRYVRGGILDRIEYGGRNGEHPAAQVVLDHAERGGPDVPSDQACADGQNCGTKFSPTFWSTKRLSTITTQVWNGSAYKDVDRWTFEHSYPPNTDNTTPSLWLHGITHTGLASGDNIVGQAIELPKVTFSGTQLPNRLNSDTDGLLPMNKWRINQINNESGGTVSVYYDGTDCSPTSPPAAQGNTKRCFPAIWTPDGDIQRNDWMNKYRVQSVALQDRVGGQQTETTSYEYVGGTAWKYDDNPLVPAARRTWSQYRGYEKVRVLSGDPTKVTQSSTLHQYFRGMGGDPITDSQGATWPDDDQLSGFQREQITYEGAGGPVVSSVINDPLKRDPTAIHGTLKSHVVEVEKTTTRTTLKPGGLRTTEVTTKYNAEGLPVEVNDLGDVDVATDNRCVTTRYARNETSWQLELVSEEWTDAVACGTTPSYPRDAVSHNRTYYDGGALGAAPTAGDATKVEELKAYVDGEATYIPKTRSTFDGYGRVLEAVDPLNRKTTTSYSPQTGLPTSTTATNPMDVANLSDDHVTTTTLDPVLGRPVKVADPNGRRTDLTYDALGRLVGVWKPGRSKDSGDSPNTRYAYGVRPDGPSWVSTEVLKPNGNTQTGYELFDGFLRSRQKQAVGPGPAGQGPLRVLTDTLYDSRGLAVQANGPYADTGTPGTTLAGVDDTKVPAMTRTTFDGAERPTVTAVHSLGTELHKTTTAYFGDRTETTPPEGGTPVTTYTDARGQLSEQRQFYAAATPTGDHNKTRYTYTNTGEIETITDAAGSTWRYTYDLLGRQVGISDPDKGQSTKTYDDAGQLTSTKDARGKTLGYRHDALGRKIEERLETANGPKVLANWTYDTLFKGQLTSSTRYVGTEKYTTAITGYDAAYRPTGKTLTLPSSLSPLNISLTTKSTYKVDGSPATVTLPALPGVAEETLTYGYDSLGLPFEMKANSGFKYVYDTAYSEFGELSQIQFGDLPASGQTAQQVAQTFYYKQGTRWLDRAVVQRQGGQPGSVQDLNYSYDKAGNVTSVADRPEIGTADVQCFTYDGLRRLSDAWTTTAATCGSPGNSGGGPAPYWTSYTYDAVGNRLSATQHGVGSGAAATATTSRYNYPDDDEEQPNTVSSITAGGTAVTAAGAYDYDETGNMTTRPGPSGTQTLTWSPQGKLETITSGSVTTTNSYDADQGLIASTDTGATTVYFGGDEIRYDKTTRRSASTRHYTFSGRTIAVRDAGGLKWLSPDHHGTDGVIVNAADSATALRRSDPFGNPRGTQPAWTGSRGFVGGTELPSGLTQLGVRQYDPNLGRFLSVDPVLDPKDPQQLNAYAYAINNPTTMTDPDGLKYFIDLDGSDAAPSRSAAKTMGYYNWKMAIYKASMRVWKRRCPPFGSFGCILNKPRKPNLFDPRDINPRYVKPKAKPTSKPESKSKPAEPVQFDRPIVTEDLNNSDAKGSTSICPSVAIAAGYGAGANACLSMDSNGFTFNAGVKQFGTEGAFAAADIGLMYNSGSADQINGGSGTYAQASLGGHLGGGGTLAAGVERSFDGELASYAQASLGIGLGAAVGEAGVTHGVNSGYFKWPWVDHVNVRVVDLPYRNPLAPKTSGWDRFS